jgi:hypothetical protein
MKIVHLRPLRHTIADYHVTHTKHGNALCGLNAEFPYSTWHIYVVTLVIREIDRHINIIFWKLLLFWATLDFSIGSINKGA